MHRRDSIIEITMITNWLRRGLIPRLNKNIGNTQLEQRLYDKLREGLGAND